MFLFLTSYRRFHAMFTIIHPDYTIILKQPKAIQLPIFYFFHKNMVTFENWKKLMNNISISANYIFTSFSF